MFKSSGKNTGIILVMTSFVVLALVIIMMIWARPQEDYSKSFSNTQETVNEVEKTETMPSPGLSYKAMFRSISVSVLLLSVLLIIAYYLKKKLAPAVASNLNFRVMSKKYIDQKNAVMLVETYGKYLLLSINESGLNLLSEIPADQIPEEIISNNNDESGKNIFANVLEKFIPVKQGTL